MAVTVKINGKIYDNLDNINMVLSFDTIASTFSFDAYFDPNNDLHRELFKPLSFHVVEIYEGSTLLLTGNILSHRYISSSKNTLVPVSGYSKTGILGDVSIPANLYPIETNQKSLKEIAERLIEPFGIGLVINSEVLDDALKTYEKSNAEASDTIAGYLSELASQRNIILSHDSSGNLLFTRPKKDRSSIATYTEGMPSLSISVEVNGQGMHSEMTVQRQGTIGSDAEGDETKRNPLITQYRPLVKEQTKGDAGDAEKAAVNALSAELKNITATIESDRWDWFNGRVLSLIQPNNYITITAPQCYLSKPSNWFVQSVSFSESAGERKAVLSCVMPESFNEEDPKNIFT